MILSVPLLAVPPAQTINLTTGLVIRRSCKVTPTWFNRPSNDDAGKTGVITVRGKNIVVDFNGATLQGTPPETDPDKRKGTAVLVEGANVTIKNLKVRGYKIGLIARNVPGLKLIDCDFSYNWKQRLMSTLEREDGSDWMSYHHNEKDEWLRYGAGIYLRDCDGFEVKGCRAVGGQNGLMLTSCDKGKVWNCNFSFLSSAGLLMYRSSDNRVMHNKLDWCARGYSHGVYNRGQDSSGVIVYEQSHRNVFAYNSVTHGGDGFFLWAGQSTMDTGKGGCNDNLLYGNDFSHAIANGIEATFSRNVFANNLMMECWHGIWAGFSYETQVVANEFRHNGEGIAWEHGQDNRIAYNEFADDRTAINLWQNERIDPNWGYGKARDCRSRDYLISKNRFQHSTGPVLRLRDSADLAVTSNAVEYVGKVFALSGALPGLAVRKNSIWAPAEDVGAYSSAFADNEWETEPAPKPREPFVDGNGTEIERMSLDVAAYLKRFETLWDPKGSYPDGDPRAVELANWRPAQMSGAPNPFLRRGVLRGRRYILIDEWGPYDFKRPILWPRGEDAEGRQVYEVLGPKGTARPITLQGVTVEGSGGDGSVWTAAAAGQVADIPVPGFVRFGLKPGAAANVRVEFEYVGEETVDVRGIVTPKGKPVRFGFRKFHAPIDWEVKWFAYDKEAEEPRSKPEAFAKLLADGAPVKAIKTARLDFNDGYEGIPRDHYATLAIGKVSLPPREYVLNVTSDDGVRVWVDGKLVIDNWTWHGPTLDKAPLAGGAHTIRVEHFEIDGYSTLKVDIQPK